MGKMSKKRKNAIDPALDYFPVFDARSQLLANMISIGWRLLIAVVLPLIAGVKADAHYGTKPKYTFIGFTAALAISAYVIYKQYVQINEEMKKTSFKKGKKVKDYDDKDDY